MHLSVKQQKEINDLLTRENITYSHLFDDLLDHLCCDIEHKMNSGLTYANASAQVFEAIGLNGLKEIQEATIFYVKLNLLVMKKFMNVTGIAGGILLVSSFLFKFQHWPGAGVLMTLGFILTFLGFIPLAFINTIKELKLKLNSPKFISYTVGFLILLQFGATFLWVIMHWPGANSMKLISFFLVPCVFFPMVFYHVLKAKTKRLLYFALAICAFCFVTAETVYNYNKQISVNRVSPYLDIEQEHAYMMWKISEVSDSITGKSVFFEINTKRRELIKTINTLQAQILKDKDNVFTMLRDITHTYRFEDVHRQKFKDIKPEMAKYRGLLEKEIKSKETKQYVQKSLSTSDIEIEGYGLYKWYKRNYYEVQGSVEMYTNLERFKLLINKAYFELLNEQ